MLYYCNNIIYFQPEWCLFAAHTTARSFSYPFFFYGARRYVHNALRSSSRGHQRATTSIRVSTGRDNKQREQKANSCIGQAHGHEGYWSVLLGGNMRCLWGIVIAIVGARQSGRPNVGVLWMWKPRVMHVVVCGWAWREDAGKDSGCGRWGLKSDFNHSWSYIRLDAGFCGICRCMRA